MVCPEVNFLLLSKYESVQNQIPHLLSRHEISFLTAALKAEQASLCRGSSLFILLQTSDVTCSQLVHQTEKNYSYRT